MPEAKLTVAEREALIAAYDSGHRARDVARMFGVSKSTALHHLRRAGVVLPRGERFSPRVNHAAFAVPSPEMCYWLGFLFADGTITNDPKAGHMIVLNVSAKDRAHLETYRRFLGSTHAIIEETKKQPPAGFERAQPTVKLNVFSRRLVADLRRWGMDGLESRVTDELSLSTDFWRGVIDGDGSLGQFKASPQHKARPRLGLVGGKALLEQFLTFVRHVDPLCQATVRPHKTIYTVQLIGRSALAVIRVLYTDPPVALDRKKERARATLGL